MRRQVETTRLHWGLRAALVFGIWSLLGLVPVAQAGDLDLDEMGAALALPIITDDATETLIVVTNTAPQALILHINVISNDASWGSANFSCPVTRSETTLFRFRGIGGSAVVDYECSKLPGVPGGGEFSQSVGTPEGIMFIAIEDPETGLTLSQNVLFGDATVIDYAQGGAFSVGAIPFQGVVAAAQNGDRTYRFDNMEYTAFPGTLASHYVNGATTSLILFTLDGIVGGGGPPARGNLNFYQGGRATSFAGIFFDCFAIIPLRVSGRDFGFFDLTPRVVSYPNTVHDAFSDGPTADGQRRVPFHGWIVQEVQSQRSIMGGRVPGFAQFGRTLNQSSTPLIPLPGDVPALVTN